MVADEWAKALSNHPDHYYAKTLARITTHGAKVGYTGPVRFQLHKPHPSALQEPKILLEDLRIQILHDRVVQVHGQPSPPFISSPLGLVPKPDGGWRRIHDLSYPRGQSVNDGIPGDYGALEYATFDDAITAVLHQGVGALLTKEDLTDAFRHIPVATSDHWLLGFHCDDSMNASYHSGFVQPHTYLTSSLRGCIGYSSTVPPLANNSITLQPRLA